MTVNKYQSGGTDPDNNGRITVGDTLSFFVQMQNSGTVDLTNVVSVIRS